jgi:hypothetical protein
VPFVVQAGVTQESVLGTLLYDSCDVINHYNCVIFVDDLKIYRPVSLHSECFLLESDIVCVRK